MKLQYAQHMQARAYTHTHAGSLWFTHPTPPRLIFSDVIHGSFTVKHRLRFDCLVGNEDDEEVDELEEIIDLHYDRRTADTEAPAPIIKNPRVRLPRVCCCFPRSAWDNAAHLTWQTAVSCHP